MAALRINRLINIGSEGINDAEEVKRIRLSNLMAITVFTTGTPFIFIFYHFGSRVSGIILSFYVLSFLIIFKLNQKQLFQAARIVMILLLNGAVLHYSVWLGREANIQIMLIPFACVPFLIFNKINLTYIISGSLISLFGFLYINMIPFNPILGLEPSAANIINDCITPICLVWIFLIMLYLTNQNYIAREQLAEQRKNQANIIIDTQEKERKRIARDLHDSLGQVLSTVKLNLQNSSKTDSATTGSIKLIDQAATEIRNIAFDLMPDTLDREGLIPAIEELTQKVRKSGQHEVLLYVQGMEEIKLPKEDQYTIYRIIQESFTNIFKHANASKINLQLIRSDKSLIITIEDDGKGFNLNEIEAGSGLKNIEARAQWLNGTFIVDSNKDSGTTLMIEVPVKIRKYD